jgi:hypothetical protein
MPANMVEYAVLTDTPVGIDPHEHGYGSFGVERRLRVGDWFLSLAKGDGINLHRERRGFSKFPSPRHVTLDTEAALILFVGSDSPRKPWNRALSCGRLATAFRTCEAN